FFSLILLFILRLPPLSTLFPYTTLFRSPFVQVGTYPTRNFATLGILVTTGWLISRRPGHFCLAPRVATRIGLSHHRPSLSGVSRTVSEDPRRISSIGLFLCLPLAFIE